MDTRAVPRAADDDVVGRLRSAGCVFAEDEARLLRAAAGSPPALAGLVGRRIAGEPLEHLLGWAQFCGLRVAVGPGVFVPRRRTELLVHEALRVLRGRPTGASPPVVVDLCCGSGAVGLAIATAGAPVRLVVADVDPTAVACAAANVAPVGGVAVVGDLFDAVPPDLRGTVDVLVANAPYVPTPQLAFMPAEARVHEPGIALDGGADGLDVLRRVAAGAAAWLAPGGCVLVEAAERQAPELVAALEAGGLPARVVTDAQRGGTAVVGGPRAGRQAGG